MLRDFDLPERDFHDISRVKLEAEGAGFDRGVRGVGDTFDSIEPSLVGVSFDLDFQSVPILRLHRSDGFLALGGVALFRDVRSGGEIPLEGAGYADLDLIVRSLEHDTGVDLSFAVFEIEREGEIGEVLFGPENGALTFWAVLGVNGAVLHGPMRDSGFGLNDPATEVFSVEKRLSVKERSEGEEKEELLHREFYGVQTELVVCASNKLMS